MSNYQPGSVVNGHILTPEGQWVSLPVDHPYAIEAQVRTRTSSAKSNAWLLWFFLGGFNAHLGYLYPKQAWAIVGGTVAAFIIGGIFTFGLLWFAWPLMWLLNWIPLVSESTFDTRRAYVREQIETDLLRQRMLYGRA